MIEFDNLRVTHGVRAPQPFANAPLPIALKDVIATRDPEQVQAEASRLAELSRVQLDVEMVRLKVAVDTASEQGRRVAPDTRLRLWLLNNECTRRAIPPVFRKLPLLNDDDPEQVADLFAIDLQWLAERYPKHQPTGERWKGIFNHKRFYGVSDWLASHWPRHQPYWFVKALALTAVQQRQLWTIKMDRVRRELEVLHERREAVRAELARAYDARARDPRYRTTDPADTIGRRVDVWFVASLADWRPQLTAELYEALCGKPMTRQLAAYIIGQIRRDVAGCASRNVRRC